MGTESIRNYALFIFVDIKNKILFSLMIGVLILVVGKL